MRWLGVLALALSTLAACAVPGTAAPAPLVNGVASTDPSVLAVIHTRPDGTRQLCTGTLVAADVVLTAKHCVFEDMGGTSWVAIPPSDLSVSLGDSVAGSTGEIAVASVDTTPGPYHDGDGAVGGDLALLHLVSNAVGLVPHLVGADPPEVGDVLRIVGFGYTGAGSTGTLGERNEGSAAITVIAAGTFTSEGASWTCTGDSGGPAFRESDGAVIGVTSIGPRGCPASTSIYTRLDANLDLLRGAGVPVPGGVPDAGGPGDDAATTAMVDGGTAPMTRSGGGCGCSTTRAGTDGEPLVLGLALFGLGVWRRSRSARRAAVRSESGEVRDEHLVGTLGRARGDRADRLGV